jgi:hypothetical protein
MCFYVFWQKLDGERDFIRRNFETFQKHECFIDMKSIKLKKGASMKLRHFYVCIVALVAVLFFSCSPTAEAAISASGDVTLNLTVKPGENTKILIKNAAGDGNSLFDAKQITENLKTENIETLKFKASADASVDASFRIPKNRVQTSNLFGIDLENKKVTCNISKETLADVIETFPQDVKDYLEMFCSPVTTGETLTAGKYEELITSTYGPKIANELKTSFFKVVLTCPGVIDSVKSEPEGRVHYFAGNSATLTVPLSYMLSLEKPLLITITYK